MVENSQKQTHLSSWATFNWTLKSTLEYIKREAITERVKKIEISFARIEKHVAKRWWYELAKKYGKSRESWCKQVG